MHRDSIVDDGHEWNLAVRSRDDLTWEPHDLVYVNKPDARVAHSILADWTAVSPGRVMFVGDSIDDM